MIIPVVVNLFRHKHLETIMMSPFGVGQSRPVTRNASKLLSVKSSDIKLLELLLQCDL